MLVVIDRTSFLFDYGSGNGRVEVYQVNKID